MPGLSSLRWPGRERSTRLRCGVHSRPHEPPAPPLPSPAAVAAFLRGLDRRARLFAAGIMPALLMTVALMVTGYVVARRRGYGTEPFPGWRAVLVRLVSALPGLGLVALIFVGIRAGIFTAVESAAIAVVYALLVTTVL